MKEVFLRGRGLVSGVENMAILVAAGAVALAAAIFWWVKTFTLPWLKMRHIPGPKGHWFYGNLDEWMDMGPIEATEKWKEQHGSIFKIFLVNRPLVLVSDPDALGQVLTTLSVFNGRDMVNGVSANDKSLLFSHGALWKRLKAIWTQMFTVNQLKELCTWVTSIVDNCVSAIGDVGDGNTFEFHNRAKRFTMSVLLTAAFGLNLEHMGLDKSGEEDIPGQVMAVVADQKMRGANKLFFALFQLLRVPDYIAIKFASTALQNSFQRFTDMMKDSLHSHRNKTMTSRMQKDFVNLMLKAQTQLKPGETTLTDEEVLENLRMFLVSGYETTAGSLAFVVFNIAQRPDVEKKLLAEIDKYNDGKAPTLDDLENYKYMLWIMYESMRMNPITPQTFRSTEQDFHLNGKVLIPKGTTIITPFRLMHYDRTLWGDPEKFRPERHDETSEEFKKRHAYAFLPFGGGPRKCVGYKFALMEMKKALIALYRNYTFTVDWEKTSRPLKTHYYMTMEPVEGIHLKVHKRSCNGAAN